MKAKGRVQGDEMLQLTEAGVPATKILQEQLGLTAKQVQNIGDAGISSDKAIRALLTGMNQRFGGMMQNQAKTALGLISTLKDTFENKLMNPWGQGLWSGIKPGLLKVTDWLDKNDKKVTELGNLFKKAGHNISTFIGGALEKSQQRLSKLMDSKQWKNADFGGKITLAWDKVIAEPFSSWWNGPGRPKINKVAGGIGSAIGGTIGGGITSFLDALGGKDSSKTGGAGTTAGTAFINGFLEAFNTGKIVDKLISSFTNANLNFLKNPNGGNFAKAGIMDYILFSSLGGAALLKGGFKLGKGAFNVGKWAFGKEGAKTAEGAAEKMAGGAGSTSARASSASNKASKPVSKETDRLKANVDKARNQAKISGRTANAKKESYTQARNTFKAARNAPKGTSKNTSDLKKAAADFRKAVNESKDAEKLRKANQGKLNKTIKDYNDFIKKSKNIPKEASKGTGIVKNVGRATRFFKSTGKALKKIPIVGNLFDFADIGLNVATAKNKKKAAAGGVGNLAGGIAGAKVGATIGSIFGPIGTGVGGFAGSIVGSVGGEKAFSWVYSKAGPAIKYLKNGFSGAKRSAQNTWSNFGAWFGAKVGTSVKNKASQTGTWIGNKFGQGKSWAQTHWAGFSGWWGANVSTPVKGFASGVGSWIGQKFSSARQGASDAWAGFSGWWSKYISEPTKGVATDVGDWIGSKLSAGRKKVETTWSDFSTWFKEHIGGPAYALLEKVMGKGGQSTGSNPGGKANGGITSGPELSWIGEAGTEAIIPLSGSRRNRGLSLWQQAGKMLGVRMFANGGIVGGSTGGAKVAKATANVSTSIALGDDALSQFKQYGNKINTNLSTGIDQTRQIPNNSINKVATVSKGILNNFAQKGHVYGAAVNNDIALGIRSNMGNVTSMVKTLTDKVITEFKNGFGIHSPSRVFYKLAQYIPQGFVKGLTSKDMGAFIKHWIGDISSMAGGAMSGNVSAWLTAALGITGTPMNWLSGLLRLVKAESGGNPMAVNPQAVNGEHATGLLQTLGSTFKQYAVKGLDNILNPIANAAAAINYIKSTYGSVYNTPLFKGGSYVGYATGTDNAKPGLARINERGWEFVDFTGGENVLNHNKSVSIMERTANSLSRVKSAASGLGLNNTRDIPESSNNPVYYTSQPQMAMAGASYGDINVDVENNFNDSTDVDGIVEKATVQFARQLKAALLNKKK